MEIDDQHSERYFTVDEEGGVIRGWKDGWDHFRKVGSPSVHLEVKDRPKLDTNVLQDVGKLELGELWPDTNDYDQNSPGILAKAKDRDERLYRSWIEKAFWLNVLRVPISVQYLAACAKVRPRVILELGTGGSSAHSTGMFLMWLEGQFDNAISPKSLISVDRHPLSDAWTRYRRFGHWKFIQGDSLAVIHALVEDRIPSPKWFDLIFIDSSHEYDHTMTELKQCSMLTDAMLMDDTTHEGVANALIEWLPKNPDWLRVDIGATVALLERHPKP